MHLRRSPVIGAVLLALAGTMAGCSAPLGTVTGSASTGGAVAVSPGGTTAPANPLATSARTSVELVGPDGPVEKSRDGIPVVLRVTKDGEPQPGVTVTLEVESGPATFPDGFEAAQTDVTGVATALSLSASDAGDVRLRVSANDYVGTVTVRIR